MHVTVPATMGSSNTIRVYWFDSEGIARVFDMQGMRIKRDLYKESGSGTIKHQFTDFPVVQQRPTQAPWETAEKARCSVVTLTRGALLGSSPAVFSARRWDGHDTSGCRGQAGTLESSRADTTTALQRWLPHALLQAPFPQRGHTAEPHQQGALTRAG